MDEFADVSDEFGVVCPRDGDQRPSYPAMHVDPRGYFAARFGPGEGLIVIGSLVWLVTMSKREIVSPFVSRTLLDDVWYTVFYSTVCNAEELVALLASNLGADIEDSRTRRHLRCVASFRRFNKLSVNTKLRAAAPTLSPEALAEISKMFGGPRSLPEWLIPVAALASREAQEGDCVNDLRCFRRVLIKTLLWAGWSQERADALAELLAAARHDLLKVTDTGSWGVIL